MCDCVCGVGEGSPQQPGCMRREQKGVNVVYFLLQVAIVFAFHPSHDTWSQSPHHGCPRPSTSTITKTHTHTHTHTDNHALRHTQWVACYSQRVYRKPPLQIGVDWKGLKSRCWQGPVWVPRWPENLINTGHWYQTHFLSLYLSMWWTTESTVKLNDALSLTFSGKTLYNWRFIRGQLNQSQL